MPVLTVVAGPNGAGKSTFSASIDPTRSTRIIDPDAIARELDPADPSRAAIAAGREAILRSRSLLASRETFILETTLAGHGAISFTRAAKAAGYRILLIYAALNSPEQHIERVRLRVASGGHDVPDEDIRRRYSRSLLRAPEAMTLADETLVVDNSGPEPLPAFLLEGAQVAWREELLPSWAEDLLARWMWLR